MSEVRTGPLVSKVVRRIAEALRPESIILFGSRARGEAGAESDVDLLIVYAGPDSKRDVKLRIRRLFPRQGFSMDLLVLTPDEYARQSGVANSAARVASSEGVVCYG